MANARFSVAPAYYTGSEVTPEVTITHSGKTLVKDRDFTVTYHNNIEPSSYYNSPWVGIDEIGNYQGYVTKSFTINRADISSCTVTLSDESLTYTGSSLRPTATVKSGDKELTLNQDYYVSYRNNWDAGTASAILTGTGNYTGSVRKTLPLNHWISAAIPLPFPSIPTPVTEQRNARMLPLHTETRHLRQALISQFLIKIM